MHVSAAEWLVIALTVVAALPGAMVFPGIPTAVATGLTGTAAAIDGPPMALLYQNGPPAVCRSTLATQFAIGTVFTLTGLLIAGELHPWQVLLGLSLMPCFLAGLGLSLLVRPRLRSRNLRPAVLTIAALTGAAAILRAIA